MPEQSREELLQFLREGLPPLTNDTSSVNAPPASMTFQAMRAGQQRLENGAVIPLDVTTGIDKDAYARIAEQRLPEDKIAVVKKLYPGLPVRELEGGDIAVQINDSETGKPKDVILNPRGIGAHDLIDLSVAAPELATSLATFIGTKGKGAIAQTARILASSIAGQAVGGVRDIVVRSQEGLDPRQLEVLKSRSRDAAIDAAAQFALGLGAFTLGKVVSPFSGGMKPGTVAFDAQTAAAELDAAFGTRLSKTLTPAERTGSQVLQHVEAFETPKPGVKSIMNRLSDAKSSAIRTLREIAVGTPPVEDDIGTATLTQLRTGIVEPMEDALRIARQELQQRGESELLSQFDNLTGFSSVGRVTAAEAGTAVKLEFGERLAKVKAEVDEAYKAVSNAPGGSGKVLSGKSLKRAADEIEAELPKVVDAKRVPDVDAYGSPVERTVEGTRILGSGVPSGLEKVIADMRAAGSQEMSLDELKILKNAARDEIAKTEAVPGVKDRWFKMVSKAYSNAIDEGVEGAKSPELASALRKAKQTYVEKELPFDRNAISDIARQPNEPGYKSAEEVVARLFKGNAARENYSALKDILGNDSIAMRAVNRSLIDDFVAQAQDPVFGTIDPKSLSASLKQFSVSQPELYNEVLGQRARDLKLTLGTMEAGARPALDAEEVKQLLLSDTPIKSALTKVAETERLRNKLYGNSLFKKVSEGLPLAPNIEPTKVMRWMTDLDTPEGAVKQVLAALDPATVQDIGTARLYQIFQDASVSSGRGLATEAPDISGKKLMELLGQKGSKERARNLVILEAASPELKKRGMDPIEFIENISEVQRPGEIRQDIYRTGGGIAAGSAIAKLTRAPLQYATEFTRNFILAKLYTSDLGVMLIGNRVADHKYAEALANFMIAAEPFTRSALEIAGPEGAKAMISDAKRSLDRTMMERTAAASKTPEELDREELRRFLRGEPSTVRQR